MLRDILAQYVGLTIVVFLITAMFSLGLDLTVRQIIEPLRNKSLVAKALLTNALVVPLIAFGLTSIIPMHEGFRIGIILYALAAGTEGGPKFVQLVHGNAAFAFGLLALLLTFTVIFLPMVLTLAVPDLQFQRGDLVVKLLVVTQQSRRACDGGKKNVQIAIAVDVGIARPTSDHRPKQIVATFFDRHRNEFRRM